MFMFLAIIVYMNEFKNSKAGSEDEKRYHEISDFFVFVDYISRFFN